MNDDILLSLFLCYPRSKNWEMIILIFYSEKDLAVCGLACVLCSEQDCPGCKMKGCKDTDKCSVYKCATEKGLDGCYACALFPCGEKMLQGMRTKAFNRYAQQFGKESLLEGLRVNFENGVTYHRPDGSKGDYDLPETEEDIMRLIRYGTVSPYIKCPEFETENFLLRLVSEEDAADLLDCYLDDKARAVFNSDNCTSDFFYNSIEEMCYCISQWLGCYTRHEFVRFAIVDKEKGRACGTVEIFGMVGAYKTERGLLRLDIKSEYENKADLYELLSLCINEFFILFGVKQIVTKAAPVTKERINALKELGFKGYDFPGREFYWVFYLS